MRARQSLRNAQPHLGNKAEEAVRRLAEPRARQGLRPDPVAGASTVIGPVALQLLRRVARHRGCLLAEVSLAVFDRVLNKLEVWEAVPITVLPACASLDGVVRLHRAVASSMNCSHAMPLDMRMALSRTTSAIARDGSEGQAIAFRHVRRWAGEEGLVRALGLTPGTACEGGDLFGLMLEINEYDDRMVVECLLRTVQSGGPTATQLLDAYGSNLDEIASSTLDDE